MLFFLSTLSTSNDLWSIRLESRHYKRKGGTEMHCKSLQISTGSCERLQFVNTTINQFPNVLQKHQIFFFFFALHKVFCISYLTTSFQVCINVRDAYLLHYGNSEGQFPYSISFLDSYVLLSWKNKSVFFATLIC